MTDLEQFSIMLAKSGESFSKVQHYHKDWTISIIGRDIDVRFEKDGSFQNMCNTRTKKE